MDTPFVHGNLVGISKLTVNRASLAVGTWLHPRTLDLALATSDAAAIPASATIIGVRQGHAEASHAFGVRFGLCDSVWDCGAIGPYMGYKGQREGSWWCVGNCGQKPKQSATRRYPVPRVVPSKDGHQVLQLMDTLF
jgi:hypothetical protein